VYKHFERNINDQNLHRGLNLSLSVCRPKQNINLIEVGSGCENAPMKTGKLLTWVEQPPKGEPEFKSASGLDDGNRQTKPDIASGCLKNECLQPESVGLIR
jgi:hypothetical protein